LQELRVSFQKVKVTLFGGGADILQNSSMCVNQGVFRKGPENPVKREVVIKEFDLVFLS
jgi:hypothetical protein